MIHTILKNELPEAMKAREAVHVSVIRDLLSSFTNELVALGKKPDEVLGDDNALKVIKRKVNQRKESIEQFEKAGRSELAEKEKKELEVLETYLPAQLSDEEISKIVLGKKKDLEVTDQKDMGKLIGAVMKDVGARADGARVQKIVQESFS